MSTSSQSKTFVIPAMDCPAELALIEQGLSGLAGIEAIAPNFLQRSITITFDASQLTPVAIAAELQRIGFPANADTDDNPLAAPASPPANRLRTSTAIGGLLLMLAFGGQLLNPGSRWVPLGAVLSAFISGWPVALGAWRAIRLGRLDMNALMTIAAVGALVTAPQTQEWLEAPTAMFLFGVSLWLESFSLGRARHAVQTLLELTPTVAHRISTACQHEHPAHGLPHIEDVAADRLVVGDRILVRPGERIPVDGVIASGNSHLNEAPITGESLPVEKTAGQLVFAGSINGEGVLEVRATQPARDSTIAHIARLVEQAHATRSPTERFVDSFARRYTPAVIVLAIAVAILPPLLTSSGAETAASENLWFDWLHRGLVLLVIACPCALVISTPVTIVCGLRRATRLGILVKGGEFLEAVGLIDALAFDKTGTLTEARPQVVALLPEPGVSENELLAIAASLESNSEHPIAAAIVSEAKRRELSLAQVADFVVHRGAGIAGQIGGEVFLLGSPKFLQTQGFAQPIGNHTTAELAQVSSPAGCLQIGTRTKSLGQIVLSDEPRTDAASTLRELESLSISPIVMLTGDGQPAAQRVATAIGISDFHAEMLPADKLRAVQQLAARRPNLAMVGDGVNDAPALAAARVGIAFGPLASATTLETADIVVLSPHLARIPELIRLGRRTRQLLSQNIILAIGIKAVVLLLALFGHATLWLAVAADVGASLLVIFNGMRLLREGNRR